jgi:hypothetical protein
MNEDYLNRAGIFLNFVAGFLLSPTLIGERIIGDIEKWAEAKMSSMIERAGAFRVAVLVVPLNSATMTVFVLALAAMFMSARGLLAFGTGEPFTGSSLSPPDPGRVLEYHAARLLFAGLIVVGLMPVVLYAAVSTIESVAHTTLRGLKGDDRLISYFSPVGIFVFFVANAMQFAATFHPGR